jgi:hypothetical protein
MNQRWHVDLRGAVIGLLVSFSLLLVASGCQAQVPGDPAVGPSGGHYIWGAEVNVFSPCGSDQEYWVDAAPDIVLALRERYMAFDLPPYTAVFVSLSGEVGPVLDCGFCEEYDGSFKVTEIIEMESPGPEECVTEMGGS